MPTTFLCNKCFKYSLIEDVVRLRVRNRLHNANQIIPLQHIHWLKEFYVVRKEMLKALDSPDKDFCDALRCVTCDKLKLDSSGLLLCPYSWDQLDLKSLAFVTGESIEEITKQEPLLAAYEQDHTHKEEKKKPLIKKEKPKLNFQSNKKRKQQNTDDNEEKQSPFEAALLNSDEQVTEEIAPFCKCDPPKETRLLTVRKQNENNGRRFYICSADKDLSCNFFRWSNLPRVVVTDQNKNKKRFKKVESSSPPPRTFNYENLNYKSLSAALSFFR